ncbi:MAG: hypothetical protein ACK5NF_07065 [Bacilli bacterium]
MKNKIKVIGSVTMVALFLLSIFNIEMKTNEVKAKSDETFTLIEEEKFNLKQFENGKLRTSEGAMKIPNPYGGDSFAINGGGHINVYKAPPSVKFSNVYGSESGLTFATYADYIAYCIEPGHVHGSGTITSDVGKVALSDINSVKVGKWARAADYFMAVDPAYWGEYMGVAQDKIWAITGRTNTGSSISQTYYNRVEHYYNVLNNKNSVTANIPSEMYVGKTYDITVKNGKIYNDIEKLNNNFDIKLANNPINNDRLNLDVVYTITPKTHGDFAIKFWSEPKGTQFKAQYIYGSYQDLFIGQAIDPSLNL